MSCRVASLLRVGKFLARGYNIQPPALAGVIARRVSGIKPGKVDMKDEKAVGVIIESLLCQVDPLTIIDGEPIAEENNPPAAGNADEVQEILG